MPKLTIYLPEQLAAEVKAAGISVSPVCQEALQREVQIMATTRISDAEISAAAKRLISEEGDEAREARSQGTADGRRWTLRWAKPAELRRMEAQVEDGPLEHRIPVYESQGYSEGDEDAPFDSIRQMLQNDDVPTDFGDEAGFEYWAAFEVAAMDTYDEVNKALAAERKS
jgi:post-segregation antitoxin (ccd killing protein)